MILLGIIWLGCILAMGLLFKALKSPDVRSYLKIAIALVALTPLLSFGAIKMGNKVILSYGPNSLTGLVLLVARPADLYEPLAIISLTSEDMEVVLEFAPKYKGPHVVSLDLMATEEILTKYNGVKSYPDIGVSGSVRTSSGEGPLVKPSGAYLVGFNGNRISLGICSIEVPSESKVHETIKVTVNLRKLPKFIRNGQELRIAAYNRIHL